MKLYHGTNYPFDKIDLTKGRRGKDFGQGFYLSADYGQALDMAHNTVDRMETGSATVLTFAFDEALLSKDSPLKVKSFDGYSLEWARFVYARRNYRKPGCLHDYDIVYGPIANDKVGLQLQRYRQHIISIEKLVAELKYKVPTFQYFFGTAQAISHLKKIEDYGR